MHEVLFFAIRLSYILILWCYLRFCTILLWGCQLAFSFLIMVLSEGFIRDQNHWNVVIWVFIKIWHYLLLTLSSNCLFDVVEFARTWNFVIMQKMIPEDLASIVYHFCILSSNKIECSFAKKSKLTSSLKFLQAFSIISREIVLV
jgi:hypothetical protein